MTFEASICTHATCLASFTCLRDAVRAFPALEISGAESIRTTLREWRAFQAQPTADISAYKVAEFPHLKEVHLVPKP